MAAIDGKTDNQSNSSEPKRKEITAYSSAGSLNTIEIICLYFAIIVTSTILRYLLLHLIPEKLIPAAYLTNIAIETSLCIILIYLAAIKPNLFSRLSFLISFAQICAAIAAGIIGANISLFVSDSYVHGHKNSLATVPLMLVVLVGPLIEEMLFRGIIFESLSRRYSIFLSVLLCSIGFASFHVHFWPGLVGGVLLTCVYIASRRSLSSSIITHMVANFALNYPRDTLLYIHYHFH